jgi:mycoredoxin
LRVLSAPIVASASLAFAPRPAARTSHLPDNRGMTVTHPVTNPATITMYGADWCGDCRRSKRFLAARETAYEWVDVDAQREIRAELTEQGYPAIPVVVLPDGTILMEPSDAALGRALDALAAAGESPAP